MKHIKRLFYTIQYTDDMKEVYGYYIEDTQLNNLFSIMCNLEENTENVIGEYMSTIEWSADFIIQL